MNVGKLNKKIEIQQRSTTQNSFGEVENTWTVFLTGVSASVEPIRGREYFQAEKFNGEVTHRIRIRYRAGIKPAMRIKLCTSRYMDIISVIDVNEKHVEIELMCKEAID